MNTVSTQDLMDWSVALAGQSTMPADSAIYIPGQNIKKVLFGIDVHAPDLLLGQKLGVDAVIAHHPADALVNFPKIFERHVDLMTSQGIPEDRARRAIEPMTERWRDRFQSANYDHVVSVARLLEMPFLNIHNPLDEYGRQRMAQAVSLIRPEQPVADVIGALMTLDEIRSAPIHPVVAVGTASAPAGRVMVVHGAGTNGGYEIAKEYFRQGIGTVVYIHLATDAKLRLRKEAEGNVVVVGHLPGDLVGIQPFVDLLREKGLEVIGFSGVS